ncbi:MAG: DUF2092 domain-containing protein [Candidatus Poribacteria bacterium]|nr:DUF2092 domain-containing protein [Candidatus Poribacteria bacterium]
MHRNVFASVIIIILLSINTFCHAADISKEELIRRVNLARMDIKSGEVQVEITSEYAARKTEEEIAESVKKGIKDELKNYVPHEGVDKETFEKEYLIPNANYHANWDRKHTEVDHITTLFQIDESTIAGRPKLYQYKLTMLKEPGYSLDSEKAQNHHAREMIYIAYDGKTQVRQNIGNLISTAGEVEIEDSDVWYGYVKYSLFGRPYYEVPAEAKLVGTETVDGTACYVLAFTNSENQKFKIWVDEAINYCIRRIVSLRGLETDQVFSQIEYKDFQQIENVWFPKIQTQAVYDKENKMLSYMTIKVNYFYFNIDFQKDFFRIDRELYGNPR